MNKNLYKDENDIYHFNAYLRNLDTDGFDPMATYNSFFKSIAFEYNNKYYKIKLKNNVSFLMSLDIPETFNFLNFLQEELSDVPFVFETEIEHDEIKNKKYHLGKCFLENEKGKREPFERIVSKVFYKYSKNQKKYDEQRVNKIENIKNLEYIDLIISNKKYKFKLNLFNTSYHSMNKAEKKALTEYVKDLIENSKEIYVIPDMPISGNVLGNLKIKTKDDKIINLEKCIKKLIDDDPTVNYEFDYLSEGIKFEALVSKVIDGDTVKIYKNGERKNIRLANIDAPEISQDYGQESKDHLAKLIGKNKHIHLIIDSDIGKYKRLVATIDDKPIYSSLKESINRKMVADGMAYSASPYLFKREEADADIYDKGLWYGKPTQKDHPEHFRKQTKLDKLAKKFKKFGLN